MSSNGQPVAAPRAERGTSLIETLVAIACLSVVMSSAMIYIVTSWRFSEANRDKVFAYEKAVSILTEMQAYLETSGVEAASDLDSFDDGVRVQPTLTITRDPVDPSVYVAPNHPSSGNIQAVGQWRWTRQITVAPFPGVTSRDLRIVTVRIYRGQDGVDPTQDPVLFPDAKGTKYAEVSSVLRTIADAYPTTQVYDIYLLAIENVPGWWVFMDAIRPFIETTIDDLQSRNPGLRFRTHWITKNGFGRDPWYRPYWNTVNDSKANVPYVHFYPSKMPPLVTDVISSSFYYVPEALLGWARTEVTAANPAGELNGYDVATTTLDAFGNTVANDAYNPFPYTLADQWNHCMRSVDEEAWFRLRRVFGAAVPGSKGSEDDAVPTWHLLLDRMKSSPTLYRNAIFINLHGELLPMPPMRAYSDPAKDSRPALTGGVTNDRFYSYNALPVNYAGGHPGVRVVTHPAQQRYVRVNGSPATSDDVQLRVYAYLEDPQDTTPFPAANTPVPDILSDPIEIQIYGINLAQAVETGAPAPVNAPVATAGIDLGSSLLLGAPTAVRSTWQFAKFRQAQGAAVTPAAAALLRIDAMQGGVDVHPISPAPLNGMTDETYGWVTPKVLGLGEWAVNHRYNGFNTVGGIAPFNAVTAPSWASSPKRLGDTYRYEGFLSGYFNGAHVYNGAQPIVRCGYVVPEMDPEGVGYTLIRLYNTPLKTPLAGAALTQGLQSSMTNSANNYRLYGRDYIPTTCEAANDFSQDLATANVAVEKNTARWRITIRKAALGLPVKVRNPRTGKWVALTAADPDHPADANDSDHWPITVATRIGSRVQDYNNDGVVNPTVPADSEESYLTRDFTMPAGFNATCFTTMEVIDRSLYSGAMREDPAPDPLIGRTAYSYRGGLRIRIPAGLEYPIGTGVQSGLVAAPASGWPATHRPEDLSTTYFWWSDLANGADVPASEQAQFIGDPRHCPYKDFKTGNFPNCYNWYFDNFRNATEGNQSGRWPGFDTTLIRNVAGDTSEGWMGRSELDVPRMMKTLRESLAEANMLWTTLTGFSYYYMGIGNEIGYDSANGYNASIPVSGMPWGTAAGVNGNEQSITNSGPGGTWGSGVKLVRSAATNVWLRNAAGPPVGQSFWWGPTWLGEQFPDSPNFNLAHYWILNGDLPSGSGNFYQTLRSNLRRNNGDTSAQPISLPHGTRFGDAAFQRRLDTEGCTSFFNIGAAASTFHHTFQGSTENGSLTAGAGSGTEMAAQYNFPLPTRTKISRPFDLALNADGSAPTEFSSAEYTAARFTSTRALRLYNHDNGQIGSGLIVNQSPAGAAKAAFILVNGIDRATESGSAFISRYSMVSLIHSFLGGGYVVAGNGITAANRIPQLPRVSVVAPTILTELDNPSTITARWHIEWLRWDGLPYTAQYAAGYTEPGAEATLTYVPMWSSDNGGTWISMVDNATVVVPGERPANAALIRTDAGVGADETFVWSTPSALFPRASYLVRIDCYRGANWLHYSYHQEKIYIDR